jgi:carbon-monoxide dehydrogenase medium subunit/6-hydroxypseudooxynicotine dehydrogenase subunit alpha
VKPPPFAYARAGSLEEALTLLAEAGPDAKLLAGGQSLVPLLAYRLVRPTHLVDIDAVPGLDRVTVREGSVELGALVRHAELGRAALPGASALLARAAGEIGHVPIRTRGTLGGSLAHADPAAELPVACLALDARIVARSLAGEREIEAASFFIAPFTTALRPDEAVVAVRIGDTGGAGAFGEIALRAGDFALAAVAVACAVDASGRLTRARVALGGVGATPARATEAERILEGASPEPALAVEAGHLAASACDVPDDVDGRHRRELVAVLVRDAVTEVTQELAG